MITASMLDWLLLGILVVASSNLVGLLALWAGLGIRHWFVRLVPLGAFFLFCSMVSAHEIVCLFSLQSVVVIAACWAWRAVVAYRRRKVNDPTVEAEALRRRRLQFSLLDLLLVTVVVAVAAAIAVRLPRQISGFWSTAESVFDGFTFAIDPTTEPLAWRGLLLTALGMGLSALAAAAAVLFSRLLPLRLALLCLTPTSWAMAAWLALARAAGWLRIDNRPAQSTSSSPADGLPRPKVRRLAGLATAVFSGLIVLPPLAALCVIAAPPPPLPQVVLPEPNGYDCLVKAAEEFAAADPPQVDQATAEQLAAGVAPRWDGTVARLDTFVATQHAVFATARDALRYDCLVPVEYSMADAELLPFRDIISAFLIEGRLAQLEGRTADAINSYCDLIRLGQASSRGGLLIHYLLGIAFEIHGIEALAAMTDVLTPPECRQLIRTLQALETTAESPRLVAAREDAWTRCRTDSTWPDRLLTAVYTMTGTLDARGWVQRAADSRTARYGLLTVHLALRCHCVDHGGLPDDLSALVPEYLAELPQDPFSGLPLVYRKKPDGYLLYSVGLDGKDDGGHTDPEHSWAEPGQDLFLTKP